MLYKYICTRIKDIIDALPTLLLIILSLLIVLVFVICYVNLSYKLAIYLGFSIPPLGAIFIALLGLTFAKILIKDYLKFKKNNS